MICVLYCLKDVLALFSYYMILLFVFREIPRRGVWRSAVWACVSIACSAAGYLLLPGRTPDAFEILDFIATVIALAGLPLVFRRPRFWRSLAVLFIYYATVDTLWSFLATFSEAQILWECVFDAAVSCAVGAAVFFSARHKDLNVLAGAFQEVPVWMLVSLFLFELTNYYKEFGLSETGYNILYVISSCLIFISILYLVFRVFRLVHTQNAILRQLNDRFAYEDQKNASDDAVRRFRHDFKNHIIVVNAMLEQGDYDGAKGYIGNVSKDLFGTVQKYTTGNPVVDSLLNVKAGAALLQDTEIQFEGCIPAQGIEPKDMCVCFGNLLDNAIEACAALPEGRKRSVQILAITQKNLLILSFVNPAAGAKRFTAGELPQTTKKDIRVHGIGLKNVRDTAKKYNGSLHLSAENGYFTAELLLERAANEEK